MTDRQTDRQTDRRTCIGIIHIIQMIYQHKKLRIMHVPAWNKNQWFGRRPGVWPLPLIPPLNPALSNTNKPVSTTETKLKQNSSWCLTVSKLFCLSFVSIMRTAYKIHLSLWWHSNSAKSSIQSATRLFSLRDSVAERPRSSLQLVGGLLQWSQTLYQVFRVCVVV